MKHLLKNLERDLLETTLEGRGMPGAKVRNTSMWIYCCLVSLPQFQKINGNEEMEV